MTNTYLKAKPARIFFLALPFLACSYACFAGGDHYEIYLNKKLVAKQFVAQSTVALNLQLDKANYNDEITIYYSHCGTVGKGRSITLKDNKGNILKEWKFDDAKNTAAMIIPAKDILDLKKKGEPVNLYYAAKELPKGRMLASINFNNKNTAANKKGLEAEWSRDAVLTSIIRMPGI